MIENKMNVYQIRIKLYFLKNIAVNEIREKLTAFIDKRFCIDQKLLKMHEENRYKGYVHDLPYPIEKDKIYKQGKVYTITIRTIDSELARYFHEVCVNSYTEEIKGLTAEIRILPKKIIESVYTLTPAVLKDEQGYWKDHMNLEQFGRRLTVNLIKKWNYFTGEKLSEDFSLYTLLELLNEGPIVAEYKGVKLLGDKIRLQIADNVSAQSLAYMALGTGICEMNSRGLGFLNYRWL